ncbi:MAG TPA: hypothetical protein VFE78_00730 [Gemmataceae bacterium]|jgi:hypothetical protein|nr:hypothetical protein [Gemmataceae bacterium]
MRKGLFGAAAALALACCSCGNGLSPVSGTLTYRGAPAAGATVHFRRTGADPLNEQSVMGIVQADGTFTLVCGAQGPGAPPGEYEVLIEWRQGPSPAGAARHGRGDPRRNPADRLKGRYADPKRPRFHAVIRAGANHLPPFELTD